MRGARPVASAAAARSWAPALIRTRVLASLGIGALGAARCASGTILSVTGLAFAACASVLRRALMLPATKIDARSGRAIRREMVMRSCLHDSSSSCGGGRVSRAGRARCCCRGRDRGRDPDLRLDRAAPGCDRAHVDGRRTGDRTGRHVVGDQAPGVGGLEHHGTGRGDRPGCPGCLREGPRPGTGGGSWVGRRGPARRPTRRCRRAAGSTWWRGRGGLRGGLATWAGRGGLRRGLRGGLAGRLSCALSRGLGGG